MTNAPERPANPYANNKANVRRNLAYKITDSYAIPREQAITLIATHGNVEDVSDSDVQQWLDKIAADCINKVTEGKPVPKNNPTPKKTHVQSVGEICNEVCMDAGLLSSDATRAHREVLAELGHHKLPAEYKEWIIDWAAKQPKPVRTEQPALIDPPTEEKKPMSSSPFGDKPLSPEAKAKLDADSAAVMARLAEQERQKTASADITPSPDVENAFNNLEQAADQVAAVVSENASISNGEAATSAEAVSTSAIEPTIENQAPTNAPDTSNVIEGEIVEDKKPEPTADEMIGKLRTEADKLIIATWPDLHSKDRIAERVAHLETAWKGCKGTHEAYAKYGYDVALKMVHDYCVEKMLQPSALAKVAEQPTNITPINAPSIRNFKMPSPEEFQMMQVFAKSVAASGLYKEINTFDKAFVILWKGFELGVGLGAALDGIYIINNRPWPGAQILKAVVMASGLAVRFDVTCDDTQAIAIVQRKGMEIHQYKFTRADAEAAGLWNNDKTAWPKHPKRMMMHRATRMAIVTDFPDLAAGIGIAIDGEDEDIIDAADIAEQKQIGSAAPVKAIA